jgi:hypothetical protein
MMSFQKLTTFAAFVFFASNSALAAPISQVSNVPSLPSLVQGVPVVGSLVKGAVGSASGIIGSTPLGTTLGKVVSNTPVVNSVIRRDDDLPTVHSVLSPVSVGTVDPSKMVDVDVSANVVHNVVDVVRRANDVTASASVPAPVTPSVTPSVTPPVALPSMKLPVVSDASLGSVGTLVGSLPVNGLVNGLPVNGLVNGSPVNGLVNGSPVNGLVNGLPVNDLANGLPVNGLVNVPVSNLAGSLMPNVGSALPAV